MKKQLRIISVFFLLAALILGTAAPVAAQTATTYLVSGTITDATAGWGVYARLDIQGFGSVVTNPSNGAYSVGLTAGTYNVTVVGLWPGYVNTTATLTVTGNMTRNFTLSIDNAVCSGPGYVAGGFTENFDGVTAPALPDGWAVKRVKKNENTAWTSVTTTTKPAGYSANSTLNMMTFNASQVSANNQLRLYRYIPVDMTATTNHILTFWMFHDPASRGDVLQVQTATTDLVNGWATVTSFNRAGTLGWAQHTVDLSASASETHLYIGFNAKSGGGQSGLSDIYIDSISLGSPTNCQPVSGGGLIIGHVLDANTGLGINNGYVSGYNSTITGSNYETITFATPADTSRPDGFFALFQPAGTSNLTAEATSYSTQNQTATVVSREVTTLATNFSLQAARLTVTGSPVTMNLGAGATGTRTITVNNTGGLAANYSLTENVSWLTLSAATTETIGPSPASQNINLSFTAGATPGIYNTSITFNDDTPYQTAPIPVTLVVSLPTAYNDAYAVDEDATLNIPAPGVLSNDQNPLGGAMTAALVSGPANGTLGFNSNGSFTYTPNTNFSGSDSFTYRAVVGASQSNVATVNLTVNALNDVPMAVDDYFGTIENSPVTMPVLQNDTDADGDTLSITAVGTPTRGSAAITPGNTTTITYIPNPNTSGLDSFSYTISDGKGGTADGTVNVTVTSVNNAPSFTTGADQTVVEDAGPTIVTTWATNISAGPNESAQIVDFIVTNSNNTLFSDQPAISAAGTLTFTSADNVHGSATVTVQIHDNGGTENGGDDTSDAQTFTITVTPVNDAPECHLVEYDTYEDTDASEPPSCDDVDEDDLTYAIFNDPSNGAASIVAEELFYDPAPDFNGSDSFTYRAYDGQAYSAPATAQIEVFAVNDPPVAGDDAATTNEDSAITISVLVNDDDVDDDPLTVTAVSDPSNGLATINTADNTITYTPDDDFNGEDSFTYTLSDGQGGSADATVTVIVRPVNDIPSFTKGADQTVDEDTGAQTVPGWATNISAGPANEDTQTVDFIVSNDNNALFSAQPAVSPVGELTYIPAANAHGSAVVTVQIHDDGGGNDTSAEQTFTITITSINDAPIAVDDTAGTGEDTPVIIDVLFNDDDADGDTLTVSEVNSPANGSAVRNLDNTITYSPNEDFNGEDSFSYTISDGQGGTASATVTITVGSSNDNPIAAVDTETTLEEHPVTINVLGNDSDPDGGTPDVQSVGNPTNGTTTLNIDDTVSYAPDADFFGTDTFTYTITDGQGGSASATVTVTVTPVNDAPSFTKGADQTVLEDAGAQTVTGWATNISTGPANENTQSVDFIFDNNNQALFSAQPAINPAGELTYTLAADAHGSATVTVQIHDNGGIENGGVDTSVAQTFTITIDSVNDVPSFNKGADQTVAEDAGAQTVNGWATAISAGPENESEQTVEFTVSNDNTELFSAQPAMNPAGDLTFTPAANAHGEATVTVYLQDNGGTDNSGVDTSATQTLTITVSAVNDAPVCLAVNINTTEDAAETTAPNCQDVDGDPLTYKIFAQPANGSAAVLDEDGLLQYTPHSDFNGNDSFQYVANDGTTDSTPANVNVSVGSVNDLPTTANDTPETNEDTSVIVDVLANDSDTDGGVLTVESINDGPDHGSAVIENNKVTYTPAADYFGTDEFTYTMSDGQGGTATALVTVTIHPVNDPPVGEEDSYDAVFQSVLTVNAAEGLLANDSDIENDSLSVELVSSTSHGTLILNPDGSFTYTPASRYVGPDSFTYRCFDGTDYTEAIKVNITVKAFQVYLPLLRR